MDEKKESVDITNNTVETGNGRDEVKGAKKSIIEEAKEAAAELREQNMLRLEILKKEEELIARREALQALGGDSKAGQRPEKREETPQEYKNRIMKGG